jgi:predicted O-methyltransferase YrrM
MSKIPGLFIGIPSSGRLVDIRWALSLQGLAGNVPLGSFVTFLIQIGSDRAANREYLAEKAVEAGARYLFMVDDDTVCPNTTLKALTYEIEKDPKIMVAAGIYCSKEYPPHPLVFKRQGDGAYWNWKVGEVFDCEGIATGCMLIKTEVFKNLPKPWFFEPDETPVNQSMQVGDHDIPVVHSGGTDDLYFCKKVIDAGFRIVAHGGILCPHIGQNGVIYTLPEDSYPFQKKDGVNIDRALGIQGWMAQDELSYLASEARKRKTIIEVGSWLGRSTCALAANTTGEVIAVDTWDGSQEHQTMMAGKDKDWAYKEFQRNTQGLPVTAIRANSLEAAKRYKATGTLADMIFIDASHDYESVKADILAWTPVLAPGGIMCGHDFANGWPEVKRAVEEMVPNFRTVNTIWTTAEQAAN